MGGPQVTATATLQCSFGVAPTTLNVLPTSRVVVEGKPAAATADMLPLVNVPTFGLCTSQTNPSVAAATAAALGVPTPMPCVPVVTSPWAPGAPKTLIGGKPALVAGSTTTCAWGGVITITVPGATKTLVD